MNEEIKHAPPPAPSRGKGEGQMNLMWESVLTEREEHWRERSSEMIKSANPLGILLEWLFVPSDKECRRRWAAGEIRTWSAAPKETS